MTALAALIRQAQDLASLPETFRRFDAAVANPVASLEEIAGVIEVDAALCARLLRLANSSLYALPRRIESIPQVLALIGLRQSRDLALATTVIELFRGIPAEVVDMAAFWRHSLAVATIARLLATERRDANGERFFVAGLLHDIGSLLLYQHAADDAARAIARHRETRRPLHEVERELLGFDHSDAGGRLLEQWRLPAALIDPVAGHHRGGGGAYRDETAAVHIADVIAEALEYGCSGETRVPSLDGRMWSALQVDIDRIPILVADADRQVADLVELFFGEHGGA